MTFEIGFIKAETHTPEYLMHKYWARKPHNVINMCIDRLTTKNDTVIDPFCGSGVVLRESGILTRKCIGFDLNPTAVLISKVLINPPSVNEFCSVVEQIYNDLNQKYGYLYKTENGDNIKYLSHRIISKCKCGKTLKQSDCIEEGKKLKCPNCHEIIHFNLENLCDTEIIKAEMENRKKKSVGDRELERQKKLSSFTDNEYNSAYNFEFPENKRILAYKGIKTANFFTARNFFILSQFADKFWAIEDQKIRDCALLLLTSTVAQCSRLIPTRNDLSTGGAAWSIPGFWIPREHLEENPFICLSTRLKKIKTALLYLIKNPVKTNAEVIQGDSLSLLKSPGYSGLKADLIFLDPPYGDSVPYTEFSNIWNSFLKLIPKSDDDISVTDRIPKEESWKNYYDKLHDYMNCFTHHLTEKGKLLITFNNNDTRAWEALLSSLQDNNFVCKSVFYQIPAVISSKAQMSPNTSYISDIYSVYEYSPGINFSKDLSPVLSHLCFIANVREGRLTKNIVNREFIIAWLKNNINCSLLMNKNDLIASIFNYDKIHKSFILKEEYKRNISLLKDEVQKCMKDILKAGDCNFMDAYIKTNQKCIKFGTMEIAEFKSYISDYAIKDGKIYGNTQLSFF